MLSQQKLVNLVSEVDPKQVLDEDVEEVRQLDDNSIISHYILDTCIFLSTAAYGNGR